ncbi:hypothetical protein [Fulvivirga sedimenti]|uniref:2-dehydro-3-deoxyphosphooctonate aldolase n=1 Tax=Fulvivirga sedimenti TaxID=2879465 RepID=A0A9X1HTQ0_9BACT|nr:hypothetical protein [Fulvivirga sedimenti]MCA6075431.1 hypothetical protein [Fulvivirga sedimenti]MCA6076608.1 hypothetical protein [Fulvivirga sedimenti]MCA6077736.1 hypothetical protein [Fulvivirga sedimenti]
MRYGLLLLVILFTRCSPEPVMHVQHMTYLEQGNQGIQLFGISSDISYGYSANNPVNIGGDDLSLGAIRQRLFLNSLAGPEGQSLKYMRIGSCCTFETEHGFDGMGLLDKYQITWEGQSEPVVLYLNMYDPGEIRAPVGFTVRL